MSRRIYLASSWRNEAYPSALAMLRFAGHEVFDFRSPPPHYAGFHWSDIDPEWRSWPPDQYRRVLRSNRIAAEGFASDLRGMQWADTCVLLLPCGRSAHLEAGWCIAMGKPTAIRLDPAGFEPELMYSLAAFLACTDNELTAWLQGLPDSAASAVCASCPPGEE
jgi:hypothetical protein